MRWWRGWVGAATFNGCGGQLGILGMKSTGWVGGWGGLSQKPPAAAQSKNRHRFFFPPLSASEHYLRIVPAHANPPDPNTPPPASPSPIHHPYRPSHSTLGHTVVTEVMEQHHDGHSSLPRCTVGVLASEAHQCRGTPHFYLYGHSSKQKIKLNWVFTPPTPQLLFSKKYVHHRCNCLFGSVGKGL